MYRPPEIVDPYLQYEVSFKVDLWMVGCVLYTLAYFTHPFVDSNAVGIAAGTYRFPNFPDETPYKVSEKIKDLIRNFLTPNPTFRISIEEGIQIIRRWNELSHIPLNVNVLVDRLKQESEKRKRSRRKNKWNLFIVKL